MKRTYKIDQNEPEQMKFDLPTEKEHLFQITDIYDYTSAIGQKIALNEHTISLKIEVVGGFEEGRTMLNRMTLDENNRGFFATRLFLKALGLDYKGNIAIDTDQWIGLQFYATVKHNGEYANIKEYNFDKKIEQRKQPSGYSTENPKESQEIQW